MDKYRRYYKYTAVRIHERRNDNVSCVVLLEDRKTLCGDGRALGIPRNNTAMPYDVSRIFSRISRTPYIGRHHPGTYNDHDGFFRRAQTLASRGDFCGDHRFGGRGDRISDLT